MLCQGKFKFPQVYVVEASAGSGKTFQLAKRYVQLLLSLPPSHPMSSILAITFTNKAAVEMKERVLSFLKPLALDEFKSEKERSVFYAKLGICGPQAKEKAAGCMEGIIANYNFFQVQTIDSFINSILNGCAFKLGLAANFKTEKKSREYLQASLDRLIDRASREHKARQLLDDFLHQYLYLEARAGWFPRQALFEILLNLYFTSNIYSGTFASSPIPAKDLYGKKKELLAGIIRLSDILPEGTHQTLRTSLEKFLSRYRGGEPFGMDDLSNYFAREQFPLKKGCVMPEAVAGQWDAVRRAISEYCRLEAFSTYNAYVEIFNAVLGDLRHIAGRDNVLFLEALNKQARGLFDEQSLDLPELYFRLARRFKHFLVDEFQDTSLLQWKNLLAMVEEALSQDGSLFYVGDRKQAIYRFRGGDADLIDTVKGRFRQLEPVEDFLTVNRRSQKEIVEFNNAIFSQENLMRFLSAFARAKEDTVKLEPEDLALAAHAFRGARQEWLPEKPAGYVQVQAVAADDGQEQQDALREKLLALAKELSGRFEYKDIAFLVRTNDEVALLTSWFLEQDIPVESEKTLDIRQHPYIKEIVSFLRFLNSPIDSLSFASFITGEVFCASTGITQEQAHAFLLSQHKKSEGGAYLYRVFREAFPQAWESHIEEYFKSVGYVPLYELCVSVIRRYRCLEAFPQHQGFFMRLLELIKEQEEEYQSIGEFLEFYDAAQDELMYVHVAESNAVKVLTIHKAKGLEFPVAVVPFLTFNVELPQAVTVTDEDRLRQVRYTQAYAKFCPEFREMALTQCIRGLMDEMNTVYVAFTRPSHELYVFVPAGGRKGGNIAASLFPQPEYSIGKKSTGRLARQAPGPLIEVPAAVYQDWIPLLKEELGLEEEFLHRREILRGEVLHALLRNVGTVRKGEEEACVNASLSRAKREFPQVKEWDEYAHACASLLRDPAMEDIFRPQEGAEIFTEFEVVNRYGDTRRIDRLVVRGKDALVVDYKSTQGAPNEAYRGQVREYSLLVAELFPGVRVSGCLVFFDTRAREEVKV